MLTRAPLTDAVISALQAAGLSVGDAKAPSNTPPFVVVYPGAGGNAFGVLRDAHKYGRVPYQVTCVGATTTGAPARAQSEWLADKVRTTLETLTVSGRSVFVKFDAYGETGREDQGPEGETFYITPVRFRITSS